MRRKEISELEQTIYDLYNQHITMKEIAKKLDVDFDTVKYAVSKTRRAVAYNLDLDVKCKDPDSIYNLDLRTSILNPLLRANYTSIRKINMDVQTKSILNVRGIGNDALEVIKREVDSYMVANKAIYENKFILSKSPLSDHIGILDGFISTNTHKSKDAYVSEIKKILLDFLHGKCIVYAIDNDIIESSAAVPFECNYTNKMVEEIDDVDQLKTLIKNIKLRVKAFIFTNKTIYTKNIVFTVASEGHLGFNVFTVCAAKSSTPFMISASGAGRLIDALISIDSINII